ncbi:hypothetical protein N7497_000016 [Penicillium chrysogenum]|uniref:Uncharacterized protein n=1 Tax=Penicillium chrysogenum TaxID=5076 RepID=A0ABQ8X2T2_PENCH|nr:hypothetical protein N7505_002670 [Penicillium chrysogenum]KAJ6167173.1 hypothetical protein N7497_000016 [Penicillium chrysogenum]
MKRVTGGIMDEITSKVSELELSSHDNHAYAKSFHDIVSYICEIRDEALSRAEIDVTKSFAGPFTSGGLLAILLEPRQGHPWCDGANDVISHCPSLSALHEGFHVTSNGILSILHGVSLLDLRPFISKFQNGRLEDHVREKLYDLVIKAMDAKKPDVILCMGEAQFSDEFRRRVEWVYAMHPSHSVNYNSSDTELRTRLLNSIAEACHKLHVKNPGLLPRPTGCGGLNEHLNPISSRKGRRDTQWVEILLQTLVVLCLRPRHRLPAASLNTNSFYKLERWHEAYFVHILESPDVKDDQESKIATSLIPLFTRLNKSMKTTSWYLQTYEANWGEITDVLADGLAILGDICALLETSHLHGTYEYDEESKPIDTKCSSDILSCGRRIALRIAALVHDSSPQPERNMQWVSFAD